MPLLRPSHTKAVRCLRSTSTPSTSRAFTTALRMRSDDSHGSHYDPPTGWLWGIPPGQKYEKEGWENAAYYGLCGSLVLAAIGYAFKPDTSIQTWALEEARRRLEAEGILEDSEASK